MNYQQRRNIVEDVKKTVKKLKRVLKLNAKCKSDDTTLSFKITPVRSSLSYRHYDQPSFSKFSPFKGAQTPPPKPKRLFLKKDTVSAQRNPNHEAQTPTEPNEKLSRRHDRKTVSSSIIGGLKCMSTNDIMFLHLKLMRDAQCVKLRRASDILLDIKCREGHDCLEELDAEKTLLEGYLKKTLIEKRLRNLKAAQNAKKPPPSEPKGKMSTMRISEINFTVKPKPGSTREKGNEFWLLALTHNTEIYFSGILTPDENGKLAFNDGFTMFDFEDNLDVKVEVFSIRLGGNKDRRTTKMDESCNLSFNDDLCVTGSKILKSSFMSCGKFNLTAKSGKTYFDLTPPKIRSISRSLSIDMLCTV